MARRAVSALVALVAVLVTLVAVSVPAYAGPGEGEFVSRTNSARQANGRSSYAVRSDLVSVARRHAQRMAAKGTIYHNPNLASEVSGWRAVGENVGMGGNVKSIHDAFMNSTHHRANILDRDFTEVGIGTATDSDGVLYVAEVFRQPEGTVRPAPAPAPKPAPQPVVTSRPRSPSAPRVTAPAPVRPKARPVDPVVALRARLAAATAAARRARPSGAVPRAVTYFDVMRTLGA